MTLREDMAADAQAAWFDTDGLAQTVTYQIPATQFEEERDLEISSLINYGENLGNEPSRYLREEMTAVVPAADIPLPKDGDKIIIGEVVWRVRGIIRGNGVAWEVNCTKGERPRMQ